MDKTSDVAVENAKTVLLVEDNTCDDQSIEQKKLEFPLPLINTISDSKNIFPSKLIFNNYFLSSFHLQLLVIFIICIVYLIFASVMIAQEHCVFVYLYFLIQGVCGLCIVIIHACAIIFE